MGLLWPRTNTFVTAMIRMLEKYAASTFDIVGNLPEDVAIRILRNLNVVELLDVETVRFRPNDTRIYSLWVNRCARNGTCLFDTQPFGVRCVFS